MFVMTRLIESNEFVVVKAKIKIIGTFISDSKQERICIL